MAQQFPPLPSALPFWGPNFRCAVKIVSDRYFSRQRWHDAKAMHVQHDFNRGTIYLRESLTYDEKWEELLHEANHAINEWNNYIRETIVKPFRAELLEQAKAEVADE